MTKTDSTPLEGVASTSLPVQVAQIEEQLNQLFACHEFYDLAIRAIVGFDDDELINANPHWQFGLFLQQQWLQDQGRVIADDLQTLRRLLQE